MRSFLDVFVAALNKKEAVRGSAESEFLHSTLGGNLSFGSHEVNSREANWTFVESELWSGPDTKNPPSEHVNRLRPPGGGPAAAIARLSACCIEKDYCLTS
jgi:hypothetical protein